MSMYQFHCLLRRFYSSIPIVGGICILISFLLIVSVYPLFCAAQEPLKKLHADGQYIKNSDGVIVNLKGFNIELHQWAYKDATYDPVARTWRYNDAESELDDDFQEMAQWNLTLDDFKRMKNWGVNLLRLQVPHYQFDTIYTPGAYKTWGFNLLKTWIEQAQSCGLYVIIDLHTPHGGRQYNTEDPGRYEGRTLWMNQTEQDRFLALWRELARRYTSYPNVLFEVMNEPDTIEAGYPETSWWNLAQEAITAIRSEGADNLIIIANTISGDISFRALQDPLHNLAYDFHFYLPFEFTFQQAFWISPPYPPANYPTSRIEYLESTWDQDYSKYFSGSTQWTYWSETLSGSELSAQHPTHLLPNYVSWNNAGDILYDNVSLRIDNTNIPLYNQTFETGDGGSPELPAGWLQWGDNGSESWKLARREVESSGNHYVRIPATPGDNGRLLKPDVQHSYYNHCPIALPGTYQNITIAASVKGQNTNPSKLYSVDWFKETLYDQNRMRADLQSFLNFRQTQNVPIMCLEFGVIMRATEAQGHLRWLNEFLQLLQEYQIHATYHVYRGYGTGSFGLYQGYGTTSADCADKYEFVLPALQAFFGVAPLPYTQDFSTNAHQFVLEDHHHTASMYLSNSGGIEGSSCLAVENRQVGEHYEVQAKKIGFVMPNNLHYQGQIYLRGDHAGTVYLALTREVDPYDVLGLWKPIQLTTAWQMIPFDFVTTGNAWSGDIRFTIMLGEYQGTVYIDHVELQYADPPGAAALREPNGVILQNTPPYAWNAVPNATSYQVILKHGTGTELQQWYTSTQANCASGVCTLNPFLALSNGTNYTWWVQTRNERRSGPWSNGSIFSVNTGPAATAPIPYHEDFADDNHDFFLEDHNDTASIWLSNAQGVNGTRCLVVTNRQVGEDYSVQAKKVGFNLQNGIRYQGSVALRGNRTGTVYAALSREASPWDNLGLWQPINLTTAWQTIPLDFTVTGNPSPGQVRFSIMLGDFQGSVFIDNVTLWQTAPSYLLWTR